MGVDFRGQVARDVWGGRHILVGARKHTRTSSKRQHRKRFRPDGRRGRGGKGSPGARGRKAGVEPKLKPCAQKENLALASEGQGSSGGRTSTGRVRGG